MIKAIKALLSGGIFGKILGVGRELIMAALFGTSSLISGYRIAQSATLIPINFFTSDALNAGFIPLYTYYAKESRMKAQVLFWGIFGILIILSFILTGVLVFGAPWWVNFLAPGFDAQTSYITVQLLYIMAVGVPFYLLSALLSYLEMANDGYRLASIRSSIQSIGLILGTIAAFWFSKPSLLAWGFTGAYIIFFSWAVILLIDLKLLTWPINFCWRELSMVLGSLWKTIKPLLLIPMMLQGNIALEKTVASLLGVNVVAALEYAKFVTETGVVLLAVPLGLAGLSSISKMTIEQTQNSLIRLLPIILISTIPVSIFIGIHSDLIVQLLYGRGAFDAQSANLTKDILSGLAIGFWAQIAGYVLIKALNAQFRNREVVWFMAIALGLNTTANLLLYSKLGPITLGIGTSIYGLALFILALRAFHIVKEIVPTLIWLCLGVAIYIPIGLLFNSNGWLGFSLAGLKFGMYWIVYIVIVPQLRSQVWPLLGLLHVKLKLN